MPTVPVSKLTEDITKLFQRKEVSREDGLTALLQVTASTVAMLLWERHAAGDHIMGVDGMLQDVTFRLNRMTTFAFNAIKAKNEQAENS